MKTVLTKLAYTVEEVCVVTGFARTRVYHAMADGSLASFKHGRRRMVTDRALRAFIDRAARLGSGEAR